VDRSHLSRTTYAGALLALVVAAAGCSGASDGGFGDGGSGQDGNTAPPYDGATPGNDSQNPHDGAGNSDTSITPDAGTHESSTPPVDTGVDTGTVTSSDGFGPSRTACIDTINALRATQSLAPYTLINTAAMDMCVDEQATTDEAMDSPHYSFINNLYPVCNSVAAPTPGPFNAQDECEGYGTEPGAEGSGPHGTNGMGIIGCLYAMWAEQYQSNCLGCVGCTAFGGACTGCDYYGMDGPECGHYVNMSASYFSMAACGFATGGGTWSAQDFY
jgi:hypothetical protein